MDDIRDLTVILKSRFPIVLIETHEEPRVIALLEKLAALRELNLFTWSVTEGLCRRAFGESAVAHTADLTNALRHIDKTLHTGLYVLLDAHPFLDEAVNLRLLREIALAHPRHARTLVLVSPRIDLPDALARFTARFALRIPDNEAIWKLIVEEIQMWEHDNVGERLVVDRVVARQMVSHLAGLCLEDARRLVREALHGDGMLTRDDLIRITRFKQSSLGAQSTLSLELDTGSFEDVGGLAALKRWLGVRRKVFLDKVPPQGLDRPKGIMLLGVQGGGKSLAAKAVAGSWGVPLLRLDFATLYNKFFGETERNLRDSLKMAEVMAPCVLWIDEIEKGIATDTHDSGTSRRVLGTLLTWMAERRDRVFLVATANDIQSLPPELIRKGRMDEIFFVDLPETTEREEIFRIHVEKRKQPVSNFNFAELARAAAGFSGSEIEQAVVAGLYAALADDRPLDNALILHEIGKTQPLSVVMAEKLRALREWAANRTVPAQGERSA